ncbi:hypothetical protein J45TS6_35940 [Paenibacillus sp. J45TS6]|uniref:hypothetical protein n=1 Tax=unclassified Paenibacillus TaxID=185978 RepID=UPI001B2386CE|nr:hypothetical protein [Paenibacillus sp. J45TS6]GIP45135.1 hypothetical protein J45TS6_35940 [Paenibacillus sp. J45TS6]
MMFDNQSAVERRDRLREEGKIELPLNVDTKKYILSLIKYRDLLISLPLMAIGILALWYLTQLGYSFSAQLLLICLSPWGTFLLILTIHHPDRKNINFFTHRVIWRIQFNKRQKIFVYMKGDLMSSKQKKNAVKDIREQLGIKNIYSECYETTDNRFVKVIRVSSVNLSLLNKKEKTKIFQAYETFLNDLPRSMLPLQVSQIAQPINLTNYGSYIEEKTAKEESHAKAILTKSYLNYIDDIQKSKNMVSRNRYVILARPFTNANRKKVLSELERDVKIVSSQIENMLGGRYEMKTKILDNEELFHLMFACIDYENAQVNFSFKTALFSPLTVGERTYEEMSGSWKQMKANHIM